MQVDGIGEALAQRMVAHSKRDTWNDLSAIKGIGPKTIARLEDFSGTDDPMNVFKIDNMISKVKEEIADGQYPIPMPTHTAQDIPSTSGNKEFRVVWIGIVSFKNIKDIFEHHRSRTGEELENVKSPELRTRVNLDGWDGDEIVSLMINRWRYPQFRQAVEELQLSEDIVVVEGINRSWMEWRGVDVKRMWVIQPD